MPGRRKAGETTTDCTQRERDFVNAMVLNGLGKKKAAIAAGCPESSAAQQATEMLGKPAVKAYLQELQDGQNGMIRAATGKRAQEIIEKFEDAVLSDIADAFDADGCVKPIDEIPEALRRSVTHLKVQEVWAKDEFGQRVQVGRIVDIKFADPTKQGDLVLKVQGAYAPIEHRHVTATLGQLLEASRAMSTEPDASPEPPVDGPVIDVTLDDD